MSKIGVGIITCDRLNFYKKCADSVLDISSVDVRVVVNDGEPFGNISNKYKLDKYIYTKNNIGVGKSKNKALRYLLDQECEHIFLLEDDVYINEPSTFNRYIQASKDTGIKHFNFCLHGDDNKLNGKANPKIIVDYNNTKVALYHNVYGALSYYHRDVLDDVGLMDKEYFNAMEHVDHTMQIIQSGYHPPFRWFADLADSDVMISEQDHGHSESKIRSDSQWQDRFMTGVRRFQSKFNINVCNPAEPVASKQDVISCLKSIKSKHT